MAAGAAAVDGRKLTMSTSTSPSMSADRDNKTVIRGIVSMVKPSPFAAGDPELGSEHAGASDGMVADGSHACGYSGNGDDAGDRPKRGETQVGS